MKISNTNFIFCVFLITLLISPVWNRVVISPTKQSPIINQFLDQNQSIVKQEDLTDQIKNETENNLNIDQSNENQLSEEPERNLKQVKKNKGIKKSLKHKNSTKKINKKKKKARKLWWWMRRRRAAAAAARRRREEAERRRREAERRRREAERRRREAERRRREAERRRRAAHAANNLRKNEDVLLIDLQRGKIQQTDRIKFDKQMEKKLKSHAESWTRTFVYDAILLTEKLLYKEQEKMFKEEMKVSKKREEMEVKKVEAYYKKGAGKKLSELTEKEIEDDIFM
jgi:hypothetical protein